MDLRGMVSILFCTSHSTLQWFCGLVVLGKKQPNLEIKTLVIFGLFILTWYHAYVMLIPLRYNCPQWFYCASHSCRCRKRTHNKYFYLNDLQVKTCDIENAYLTAPASEKLFTELGPEFGADAGKISIIVRALHGTKSAGVHPSGISLLTAYST